MGRFCWAGVGLDCMILSLLKDSNKNTQWIIERTNERIKETTTLLSHKTKQFRVSKHFRAHTQIECVRVSAWCIVAGCLLDWDLVFGCARALLCACTMYEINFSARIEIIIIDWMVYALAGAGNSTQKSHIIEIQLYGPARWCRNFFLNQQSFNKYQHINKKKGTEK